MPQADRRHRSGADGQQSVRRQRRAQRNAERQAIRHRELEAAMTRGDAVAINTLAKKIAAADRAVAQHKPDASTARKIRLAPLTTERDQAAWAIANKITVPRRHDELARVHWPTSCGQRDGAKIAAASPQVQLAMSRCEKSTDRANAAYNAMRDAVLLAGGSDRRLHPLQHGVVSGNDRDDLVERALMLAVAAGADIERDPFVVIEHDGEGSEQGRHAHVIWCGPRDCGHGGAAVAARCWAAAAGNPEAAQRPSLGTGIAARRDWQSLPKAGDRIAQAQANGRLGVPAGAAPGGLFLFKGAWSASDSLDGQTERGKPRKGALSHIFGRD